MFCKNCGAKFDENAKFCPTCGDQVNNGGAQKSYTAPKPFEQNSVDGSQNYHYQKSAFKGKQFTTGTSGKISFGGGKKKGFLRRLIKFGIIIVVAIVAFSLIFGGSGVYNIETGTSLDLEYFEVIDRTSTFYTDTPEIFVSFSISDYPIGTSISADWYSVTHDTLITSSQVTTVLEESNGYFSLTMPTAGWPTGDYEIIFYADGELVDTVTFTIE